MLKKIRVGRSEIIFFLILFFITGLILELHLECISTLEKCHLTHFCQNNSPFDTKNTLKGKNRAFK